MERKREGERGIEEGRERESQGGGEEDKGETCYPFRPEEKGENCYPLRHTSVNKKKSRSHARALRGVGPETSGTACAAAAVHRHWGRTRFQYMGKIRCTA